MHALSWHHIIYVFLHFIEFLENQIKTINRSQIHVQYEVLLCRVITITMANKGHKRTQLLSTVL